MPKFYAAEVPETQEYYAAGESDEEEEIARALDALDESDADMDELEDEDEEEVEKEVEKEPGKRKKRMFWCSLCDGSVASTQGAFCSWGFGSTFRRLEADTAMHMPLSA